MANDFELPKELINQVKNGTVVLFLGAGATKGAYTPDKKEPPLGNDLRDLISARFLQGDHSTETLSWVCELAISESNLFDVQDFIADHFRDLIPSNFHAMIPKFKWRGIATTNFDRLIETIYGNSKDAMQQIVPFLSNFDRVDQKLRDSSSLALLKLHGCITRTHDEQLPLILTTDQYIRYKHNRKRLFDMFEEWGSENIILFVGHKLQDINLRNILLDISDNIQSRPRYYLVRPNASSEEIKYWNLKKITVLNTTFEVVLMQLDRSIPEFIRPLVNLIDSNHPINPHFKTKDKPSQSLLEFLSNDFEFIHQSMAFEQANPKLFFSGFDLGWYPIISDLDVQRNLTSKLVDDIVLRLEEDRPSLVELYVIKAEAGAGKSVLLKRLAWDAATKAKVLCLFSKGATPFDFDSLQELCKATGQRLFLFVDNSATNLTLILYLLEHARRNKIQLTLITAERINEWNTRCDSLEEYLTDQYELSYLNRAEIEDLVKLLNKHDSLGPNLTGKAFEKQVYEFEERAGRQLLVALHEATQGRPFEEILIDEYNNIRPPEAQRLYLTVCVLNRLNLLVRAGLISRIHEIPFEMFKERFFRPLEKVVKVEMLPWRDYAYKSRHSEIAQIIFDQILVDSTDRYNEYIRIIKSLIPNYSVDYLALRGLIHAKAIAEYFPKYEDAKAIFDSAELIIGNDPYFMHQRANYERKRKNGDLKYAQELLEKAHTLYPTDLTIVHTLAEVLRSRASLTDSRLERIRFRREALAVLKDIFNEPNVALYAAVTYLKLIIDKVTEFLNDETSTDRDIDESLREFEKVLNIMKQRYPEDQYILAIESEFAQQLKDDERSYIALSKAYKSNSRDPYIASRLAAMLISRGDNVTAKNCIKEALNSNGNDKKLNYQYAELLRKTKEYTTLNELLYHYQRAFSKNDTNYESQFWYARFSFEAYETDSNKIKESKVIFRYLRDVALPYDDRIKLRDIIGGFQTPRDFSGTITRIESTHGFISIDGRGDSIFFHEKYVSGDVWELIKHGKRVIFNIGFNFSGPIALNLHF